MKINTKVVSILGVVIAAAAVLADPSTTPFLVSLLGEHAATKIAALGALISALGKSPLATTEEK